MAATFFAISASPVLQAELQRWSAAHALALVELPSTDQLWPRLQPEDAVGVLLATAHEPSMDAIESLCQRIPELPVIVALVDPPTWTTVRCMRAGVATVIDLAADLMKLDQELDDVLARYYERRQRFETRRMARDRMERLTDGERAVLELMLGGEPNKLIAKRLDVSQRTVEARRARIFSKLQASSLAQLVRLVTEHFQGDPTATWFRVDPPQSGLQARPPETDPSDE
jgi:FixJ family two-component response regulator